MRAGGAGRPRAAGTAGWRPGQRPERALRCLTSPWCQWTGRDAATMTTSRDSVGWTTGSAPSGKTRTVRVRPAGAGTGGVYTGPARAAGPRASTSMRDSTFLAPRALRPMSLLGPGLLSQVILHPPAPPAPPPRAAGGGCRRGRPGRPASRLPRSGWCRTRVPGPDQAQQKPGLQLPRFP